MEILCKIFFVFILKLYRNFKSLNIFCIEVLMKIQSNASQSGIILIALRPTNYILCFFLMSVDCVFLSPFNKTNDYILKSSLKV